MTTTVNQKVANPYFTESSSTFATDITVNGLTVGKGSSNVATNTAFGFDALGSSYASASNVNNVGIGYNALNIIGAGVNTFTNLVGGSGYVGTEGETTFTQSAYLTYLSGTPLISGGQFPPVNIQVTEGIVTSVALSNNLDRGYGFTDTTTVMTAAIGGGSGFSIKVGTLLHSNNNVAIGYDTGLAVSENAISIGSGAKASSNTVELGNSSIEQTNFYGNLNNDGGDISFSGSLFGDIKFGYDMLAGKIDIGGLSSYGDINIGLSTQTVNISTGAVGVGGLQLINIGNGTGDGVRGITIGSTAGTSTTTLNGTLTATGSLQLTGSATANQNIATSQTSGNLVIGGTTATGAITLGQSSNTQTVNIATGDNNSSVKTVNIGTNGTGSTTGITIGSTLGSVSTTTIRGALVVAAIDRNISLNLVQSTGLITIGGTSSASGTITLGQSTVSQTTNIQAGATASGSTKTLNIGTGGLAGSTTNITIGSTAGTSTTTVNGYFKPPALASAPTYVKGAVYFDTTLNKLRVGGATTWETITSA